MEVRLKTARPDQATVFAPTRDAFTVGQYAKNRNCSSTVVCVPMRALLQGVFSLYLAIVSRAVL
jgi:hypothetical protein